MNQHGLSRHIPEAVKRRVRQECGFGCVVCARLGVEYEHFSPEFSKCTEHRPEGIALLCPTCHLDKTAGRLAPEQVATARLRASRGGPNPLWRTHFSGARARLRLGNNVLVGQRVGLSIGDQRLLEVGVGADESETWTLTGVLAHGEGSLVRFNNNEVEMCRSSWDVEMAGKTLTIRSAKGLVALQLSLEPHEIGIERLALRWPSGMSLDVEASGDIVLDRLMHSEFRNFASDIRLMNVRVEDGGPNVPIILVDKHATNCMLSGVTISDCHTVCAGLVDIMKIVDLRRFVSPDCIAL